MNKVINENLNLKEYLTKIVQDKVEIFNNLTKWDSQALEEYNVLLKQLKDNKNKGTTKEKGDKLERLVNFIIDKSFFFDVYRNVRTATNEIDQVITLSNYGRQALAEFNISRDLLPINEDIILGECKNYSNKLSVTYVGKFYSLMSSADISFGIIFTQKGLTGNPKEYHNAFGLVKVLRIIEKYQKNKELFIITFAMDDFEKIAQGISFYDLIRAKKNEIQLSANFESFINKHSHENEEKIIKLIQEYQ